MAYPSVLMPDFARILIWTFIYGLVLVLTLAAVRAVRMRDRLGRRAHTFVLLGIGSLLAAQILHMMFSWQSLSVDPNWSAYLLALQWLLLSAGVTLILLAAFTRPRETQ